MSVCVIRSMCAAVSGWVFAGHINRHLLRKTKNKVLLLWTFSDCRDVQPREQPTSQAAKLHSPKFLCRRTV